MRHGGRPPHCASTQQILELRDQGATWNVVPKRVDMTVSGALSHYRRTGRGYAARKITAATISGQLVAFSASSECGPLSGFCCQVGFLPWVGKAPLGNRAPTAGSDGNHTEANLQQLNLDSQAFADPDVTASPRCTS